MRAVLLVLACAGCDGVFGIHEVPLPVDAARAGDGAGRVDGTQLDSPTVMSLTSLGLDATQTQSQTVNADDAIGLRITVSSQVTLRKVGLYTTSAGTHARFGVYGLNSAMTPGQLQVASAPLTLVSGRNETDVNPTTLAAGDYWLVVDFDGATSVQYTKSGLYGTSNYPYANTMPLVWSSTWVDVLNSSFALFLRVEQ